MRILLILCLLLSLVALDAVSRPSLQSSTRLILKNGQIFKKTYSPDWAKDADLLAMLTEVNSDPHLREEAQNIVRAAHGEDMLVEFKLMLSSERAITLKDLIVKKKEKGLLLDSEEFARVIKGTHMILEDLVYVVSNHSKVRAKLD